MSPHAANAADMYKKLYKPRTSPSLRSLFMRSPFTSVNGFVSLTADAVVRARVRFAATASTPPHDNEDGCLSHPHPSVPVYLAC